VEVVVIQYRHEQIAVFWNSVEDEMPLALAANRRFDFRIRRKFDGEGIEVAQFRHDRVLRA
jgi:hypothetical protein